MKFHIPLLNALAFTVALTGAAAAVPLERGRDGLEAVTVTVSNDGADAISCGATLAHWYSQGFGTVAPGAKLSASLWLKRDTGAIFLLNALEDRMPVERLWCGAEGKSWVTRSEIALERHAGEAVAPIRLDCRTEKAALLCRRN